MIRQALEELETYLEVSILEPAMEARARSLIDFADRRMRAGEQTVVALAGATGSGKSSLFNALSGTTLAAVAARRPTTSKPVALSFSATNGPLLNLLRITRRHEALPPTPTLADVVLLDLPDHDSTQLGHREEVDRLVEVVDQFIFVVDPQKYADAALHERYLRPLAAHRDVISIVLNHADALTDGAPLSNGSDEWHPELARVVDHLRGILADDGLEGVPIFATNAVERAGIEELRGHIGSIATAKRATRARIAADLHNLAHDLRNLGGHPGDVEDTDIEELQEEVAAAAGVERRAAEVRRAVERRGAMLRGRGREAEGPLELPAHRVASAADDARTATAVRHFVATSTERLPERWREAVRARIGREVAGRLGARIDTALRAVDLDDIGSSFGWGLVRVLKWLPIVVLVACGGWLAFAVVWGDGADTAKLLTIVVAALVGTVLIGWIGDRMLRASARRAGNITAHRLRAAVDAEVLDAIVADVRSELSAHRRAESALQRMTGILARG